MNEVKRLACDIIDQSYVELNKISQSIWHRPELGYNEHHAHSELTDFLEKSGFNVEKSFKLDTAFRATYSNDSGVAGPNIAMLCEYDALPGIGHACGHNLIAEIGIAAATGVKGAMIAAKDKQAFGKVGYTYLYIIIICLNRQIEIQHGLLYGLDSLCMVCCCETAITAESQLKDKYSVHN